MSINYLVETLESSPGTRLKTFQDISKHHYFDATIAYGDGSRTHNLRHCSSYEVGIVQDAHLCMRLPATRAHSACLTVALLALPFRN